MTTLLTTWLVQTPLSARTAYQHIEGYSIFPSVMEWTSYFLFFQLTVNLVFTRVNICNVCFLFYGDVQYGRWDTTFRNNLLSVSSG